jgi:hypothetical protein
MLGDRVEQALTILGVTQERVTGWLGKPCRCGEYIERLNQLDRWARRVVGGKLDKAKHYLQQILDQT